jgi:hypothetical protein
MLGAADPEVRQPSPTGNFLCLYATQDNFSKSRNSPAVLWYSAFLVRKQTTIREELYRQSGIHYNRQKGK